MSKSSPWYMCCAWHLHYQVSAWWWMFWTYGCGTTICRPSQSTLRPRFSMRSPKTAVKIFKPRNELSNFLLACHVDFMQDYVAEPVPRNWHLGSGDWTQTRKSHRFLLRYETPPLRPCPWALFHTQESCDIKQMTAFIQPHINLQCQL